MALRSTCTTDAERKPTHDSFLSCCPQNCGSALPTDCCGHDGEFQDSFKTAWESLLLVAHRHETKRAKPGVRVDRAKLRQIDLHCHDLRHEGASLLAATWDQIDSIRESVNLGANTLREKAWVLIPPSPQP